MNQDNVKNIFSDIQEKYGKERSFGRAESTFLYILTLLESIDGMRKQNILPEISSEESKILGESSLRIEGLIEEIRHYNGKDDAVKNAIISAIEEVGNKIIPLCRLLLSSPNTSQAIIGINERVEKIKKELEVSNQNFKSFSEKVSSFDKSVNSLKVKLLEEASNVLGKSFHETSKSAQKFKWFWFVFIILGILFFYCEATKLATMIGFFIEEGKTSYEIILMLVIERFALIFLPAIWIYFSMKQFNAVSHIQVQNNHKGNIGDVFAKIYLASEGNETLNVKVSELLIKLAEEYSDGYIDSGGVKIKKIITPWGEIDANS